MADIVAWIRPWDGDESDFGNMLAEPVIDEDTTPPADGHEWFPCVLKADHEAALAAAVADAERYRWLKECTNEQFEHLSGQWCALDLTIDVMMKIEHNGGYASTSAMKCQHVFDDDRCVICGSVA